MLNRDAYQCICKDGANPPENHNDSQNLRSEAKCGSDEDAIE